MTIRPDIADMLRAGHSDHEISRQLHICQRTAAAARRALGMPVHKAGYAPAASPQALFRARTRQAEDGHLEWIGSTNVRGAPSFRWQGHQYAALTVAFVMQHGRDPVGHVRPGCGHAGCVAQGHLEDRPMRDQLRNQMNALFGGTS